MRLNAYKSYHQQSAGFALVAAIFLIVVVGLLITYLQRLSSNQANVNAQAVQNTRALQAAQSGLEWGVYQLTQVGATCPDARGNFAVTGVAVVVTCASATYTEAGVNVIIYTLTSTAEQGALGNPDYAFKRMTAIIEI